MTTAKPLIIIMAALTAMLLMAAPATADPADIRSSARSVARIILVERNDEQVSFIGHGSGFAVAPNLILTNAHVVAPTIENSEIIIGVVPSEGNQSYGGKVIAYSPRNDLALIQMDAGNLPPLTLYTPVVSDGSGVFAIGYPGAVDRALGLTIGDLVEPGSPVKTPGTISSGLSPREFDSLLHTAPMAQGNSGGPLVDNCGRVVGANSFGTLSDGSDAEFAFAISNIEILPFLRDAGVTPATASTPCLSSSQVSQAETQRLLAQIAGQSSTQMQEAEEKRLKEEVLARSVDHELRNERDTYLVIALFLGLFASFGGSVALSLFHQQKQLPMQIASGTALLFLLLAGITIYLRPSYDEFLQRLSAMRDEINTAENITGHGVEQGKFVGKNICKLDRQRSRLTVSNIDQLSLEWNPNGCINNRTVYARDGDGWTRIFVPKNEQTISVNRFDPDAGEFRISRYLAGRTAMENAREVRNSFGNIQCPVTTSKQTDLKSVQDRLKEILPPSPNEILIFACTPEE